MKKYVKILGVIIIIAAICAIILYLKNKPKYTLEELASFINNDIGNNMYMKIEVTLEDTGGKEIDEYYMKDNNLYRHSYKDDIVQLEDALYNYSNSQEISIDYTSKTISVTKKDTLENPIKETIQSQIDEIESSADKYEYLGTEEIDGKEYIVFSLEDKAEFSKTYYYLDYQNGCIDKIEYYSTYNDKLMFTYEYTYSYDTVTDDDILTFDISDYDGFTISSVSSENAETEEDSNLENVTSYSNELDIQNDTTNELQYEHEKESTELNDKIEQFKQIFSKYYGEEYANETFSNIQNESSEISADEVSESSINMLKKAIQLIEEENITTEEQEIIKYIFDAIDTSYIEDTSILNAFEKLGVELD